MIKFTAVIHKFGEKGEKTGWTYIEIPGELAEELNAGVKKSYRVKGMLDHHKISGVPLIPMGGGIFILAVNAAMRKAIAKKEGAMVAVKLEVDTAEYDLNRRLLEALESSLAANNSFYKMPRSHQNYYSRWIESAKTIPTQERRIVTIILSLEKGLSYSEMIREQSDAKKLL